MMLTHCGNNVRNRYSGCVFSVKDIVPVPLKTSRNLLFSILTVGGIGVWWLQREVETVASEATPAAAEKSEGGSQTSSTERSRATPGGSRSGDEAPPPPPTPAMEGEGNTQHSRTQPSYCRRSATTKTIKR